MRRRPAAGVRSPEPGPQAARHVLPYRDRGIEPDQGEGGVEDQTGVRQRHGGLCRPVVARDPQVTRQAASQSFVTEDDPGRLGLIGGARGVPPFTWYSGGRLAEQGDQGLDLGEGLQLGDQGRGVGKGLCTRAPMASIS